MIINDFWSLMMNRNAHFTHSRFNNKYLDVDDILATQERVMCNFEVPVLNMGMDSQEHLVNAGVRAGSD